MEQRNLLLKVARILEENDIDFWLDCGTLLGAYREKDFIKWDDKDIDVGIFYKDYWRARGALAKAGLNFKYLWRGELAVYDINVQPHLDLFCYEEEGDKLYLIDYVENPYLKHYTLERRAEYKKSDLLPFKTTSFIDHEFKVPVNCEAWFEARFGANWRQPDPNWTYYKAANLDNDYRQIAFLIPTFIRDDKMMECVNSIRKTYPKKWIRIYIADQGGMAEKKKEFYEELKKEGHRIFTLPYNSGLSKGRNLLIEQVKEPFLIVGDDDFLYDKSVNLLHFINILLSEENIGIVGGEVANRGNYCYNLYLDKKNKKFYYLKKNMHWESSIVTRGQRPVRYCRSDIVLNFFMAKREVFNDIKWDENLKLVEHTDFFLRFKNTKWAVTFTDQVKAKHQSEKNSDKYHSYRNGKVGCNVKIGKEVLTKKYGFNIIDEAKKVDESSFYSRELAFLCVNFFRKEETKKCITSFKKHYPLAKVYVADQDPKSAQMEIFYKKMNVEYYFVEFDWGLSNCRNFLVDKVKERFILWGDNDFVFSQSSNINIGIKLLCHEPQAGIVGGAILENGKIKHYERYMFYDKNSRMLVYLPIQYTNPKSYRFEDASYYYADLTFNYAVAKRELFDNQKVRWNPNIKVRYEHSDFFLRVKTFSDYKVIYCPQMQVIHAHKRSVGEYGKFRARREDADAFRKSWGIDKTVVCGENTYWDFDISKNLSLTYQPLPVNVDNTIMKESIKNVSANTVQFKNGVNGSSPILLNSEELKTSKIFQEVVSIMNRLKIPYCLLYTTCLDAIRYGKLQTNLKNICFGCPKTITVLEHLHQTNFIIKNNDVAIKDGITVHFLQYPKQTKIAKLYGTQHNIPYPAIPYLRATFGVNWKNTGIKI